MHLGKWVTGKTGTKRIVTLVEELDRKHYEHISTSLNTKFENFEPWMSCTTQIEYFSKNWPVIENQILTQNLPLQTIADGLKSNNAPFGNLGMQDSDGFQIELNPSDEFQKDIEKALHFIFEASTKLKTRWEKLVQLLVPIKHGTEPPSKIGRGLSNHLFRKCIFIELPIESPKKDLQIALNLVHELGHQALITYQNADLIIETNRDQHVHSVIRNTKRPIIRSYHAFFVSGYMLEFLIEAQKLKLSEDLINLIQKEKIELRRSIFLASNELRKAPVTFTQLGLEIINEFESLATAEVIQ